MAEQRRLGAEQRRVQLGSGQPALLASPFVACEPVHQRDHRVNVTLLHPPDSHTQQVATTSGRAGESNQRLAGPARPEVGGG
ncbi:MAG TPA: hypothetical protein VF003_05780 [Pseudonocardiaceae bacterium]